MSRPTWHKICMDLAKNIAQRSTCSNPERKVGCVITDKNHEHVLSWGYNGVAAGEEHQCEYLDNDSDDHSLNRHKCGCIHAETNALVKLDSTNKCDKIMYLTLSPCLTCARLIINTKTIKEVYFSEYYSDKVPIEFLNKFGVKTYKI